MQKLKEKYEGCVFRTNCSGELIVLEYINTHEVLIKFLKTGREKYVAMSNIKRGAVLDRAVGVRSVIGFSDMPSKENINAYYLWSGMFKRCYSSNKLKLSPSYRGCEVAGDFLYFSKFLSWCEQQKGFGQNGFQLDKDILLKDNKLYSAETCCFVPKDLNVILTHRRKDKGLHPVGVHYNKRLNKYVAQISKFKEVIHLGCFSTSEEAFLAYKQAKEEYIKEVAELYKDQIESRVYDALIRYEVDIND